MKDPIAQTIAQHHTALRTLSARSWNSTVQRQSRRELFGAVILAACAATALLSVILLMKYQGSIPVVTNTTVTDKFGQVIAKSGAISRVPAQVAAHSVIYRFILDSFSIYNSPIGMQMNTHEALSFVANEDVAQTLRNYWAGGPLKADGTWVPPIGEQRVEITSILQRGNPTPQGTEYEVQWTLQQINAPNPPSKKDLYLGDLILASGGQVTDANTAGLAITHFSFGRMK